MKGPGMKPAGELPRLCVVADLGFVGDQANWLLALRRLGDVATYASIAVQVRAKRLAGTALADAAGRARQALGDAPLAVLNGPAELATALGYDGVHWPQAHLPQLPSGCATASLAWRSAAVHSVSALAGAERAAATALVFAPVFSPTWKTTSGAGLAALRDIVQAATLPVYALGGIDSARAGDCLDAGAYGVAVSSGILAAQDIAAATIEYVGTVRRATPA